MPAPPPNDPHNFGLDLVRAAAILAVLFSHTTEWFMGPGRATDIRAAYVGGTGVEVFFSLSGFLIGAILLRMLDRGPTAGRVWGFWSRRWMRTLPAYWVTIGALSWWFGASDWRSFVFLQNFVPKTAWVPLTPHTWSLVLEEWFYLFVPPLALLVWRGLPVRARPWAVPVVCGLLWAWSIGLRSVAVLRPDPAFWGTDLSINPLLRMDCAAFGVLGAWIVWRRAGRDLAPGVAAGLLVAGVAALFGLGVVFELSYTPERLIPYGYMTWGQAWSVLRTTLVEGAALLVLVGLRTLVPRARGAAAWGVGTVARLSYALYLVHVPVLYVARANGVDDSAGWGARGIMVGLILAAAVAIRMGVERPVIALRDRLVPDRRAAAVAFVS